MATKLEQVLARLDALLRANLPGGTNVYGGRADPISQEETPAVNVLAQEGDVEPWSEMDRHDDMVDLVFHFRSDAGDAAAETMHQAVHTVIVTDAVLAGLCESRRLIQYGFDRAEADATSLKKRARYRFTYLTHFTTL